MAQQIPGGEQAAPGADGGGFARRGERERAVLRQAGGLSPTSLPLEASGRERHGRGGGVRRRARRDSRGIPAHHQQPGGRGLLITRVSPQSKVFTHARFASR